MAIPLRTPPDHRSHLHRYRQRAARRAVLTLAAALAPSLLAVPATGIRADAEGSPQFFLETIAIEGVRTVSPAIIRSESHLEDGSSYDEGALRDAIHRLRRLPFVLDAHFALRRGSIRDRFELVITVEEARRGFFGAELTYNRYGDPVALEGPRFRDNAVGVQPLAGVRLPAGTYGLLFAAASLGPDAVQVGYTRYRLFGWPATLSLGYAYASCCPVFLPSLGLDPTFSSWHSRDGSHRLHGELDLPMVGNHSLMLAASLRHSEGGERQPVLETERAGFRFSDRRDARLALGWRFDTTDDPHLPTRGLAWNATLDGQHLEADLALGRAGDRPPGRKPLPALESEQLRLAFAGRGHRSFGRHQTLTLEARLAVGRAWVEGLPVLGLTEAGDRMADETFDVWEAFVALGHSFDFTSGRTSRWGALRWETRLSVGYDGTFPDLGLRRRALERLGVRTGIVLRNAWGIFRIGFVFEEISRTG